MKILDRSLQAKDLRVGDFIQLDKDDEFYELALIEGRPDGFIFTLLDRGMLKSMYIHPFWYFRVGVDDEPCEIPL